MAILHFFEQLRTPFLDGFFLLVTELGSQTIAAVVLMILLWCIDKRRGYMLALAFLLSTSLSQFFKGAFQIERPFLQDPTLEPVQQALSDASGYSFPSGHTQAAGILYGDLILEGRRWYTRLTGMMLLLLVAVSRMYLGVHTPIDILGALILSGVVLILTRGMFLLFSGAGRLVCAAGAVLGGGLLCAAVFWFMKDLPLVAQSIDHLQELLGLLLGLCAACWLDERVVQYREFAPWYFQILKVVVGALTSAGLYLLFRAAGLTEGWWSLLGNALLVLYIGGIYPMTFRWYQKPENNKEI